MEDDPLGDAMDQLEDEVEMAHGMWVFLAFYAHR